VVCAELLGRVLNQPARRYVSSRVRTAAGAAGAGRNRLISILPQRGRGAIPVARREVGVDLERLIKLSAMLIGRAHCTPREWQRQVLPWSDQPRFPCWTPRNHRKALGGGLANGLANPGGVLPEDASRRAALACGMAGTRMERTESGTSVRLDRGAGAIAVGVAGLARA